MSLLKTTLAVALAGGFLMSSAQAGTIVSWNTAGSINVANQLTFGDLKVRAYSTTTVAAAGTRGGTDSSSWLQAQLAGYSGGFGVRNACAVSGANGCTGQDGGEGSQPEHAVDNEQVVDVVVFELPTMPNMTWSFSSLSIGYAQNDLTPEINVWVGGSGLGQNYNFSDTCFINCNGGDVSLTNRGFTYAGRIDFPGTGTAGINSSSSAHDTGSVLFANRNAAASGQYIVVAASSTANGAWDAFKISGISATKTDVPPPPPGQVPEPGSLLLLGSGMLGFAWLRRRQSRA